MLRKSLYVLSAAAISSSLLRINSSCDKKAEKPFDCQQAACQSKQELFQQMYAASSGGKKKSASTTATEKLRPETDIPSALIAPIVSAIEVAQCPLDKAELGRSAWNVIHTVAAYYPDEPTLSEQDNARHFISALAGLYPCHICKPHFVDFVANNPPRY